MADGRLLLCRPSAVAHPPSAIGPQRSFSENRPSTPLPLPSALCPLGSARCPVPLAIRHLPFSLRRRDRRLVLLRAKPRDDVSLASRVDDGGESRHAAASLANDLGEIRRTEKDRLLDKVR